MAPYLGDPDASSTPEQLDEYVQSHTRFHAAVASLAANRVLELSLQVFGQIVGRHAGITSPPQADF